MNKFDMIQYPEPKQEYKVLVRCYTYNHSNYIEDALNGFAMQQTNFPFVCVVVDDASTYGEQEVIKAWMERECEMSRAEYIDITTSVVIIVPHKTNLSCTFAFYLLKKNLYGTDGKKKHLRPWREKCKYEALCEGDDYWIDPLKLQKQVDFLDNNPDYGMCYTNFNIYNQKTKKLQEKLFTTLPNKYPSEYKDAEEFIYRMGYVCPPSWLYRIECIPKNMVKSFDGTFVMFTHFLCSTKVHCIMDTTTTYRVLLESASHSINYDKRYIRAKNLLLTQHLLLDKYVLNKSLKEICESTHYKKGLLGFVVHNKQEDIEKAKRVIRDKGLKETLLFLLNSVPGGRLVLRIAYYSFKFFFF